MESADDDAGAAASASRPVAAREMRDGESAAAAVARPSDTAVTDSVPPADIPAITDDCFDGDSVPSPSAQDINTSTEAILDMIDEIVDGPGAPKRLPLFIDTHSDIDLDVVLDFEQPAPVDTFSAPEKNACASDNFSNLVRNFNVSNKDENLSHSSEPSATSAKSDNLLNANISPPSIIRTDLSSQGSTSAHSMNEISVESPQASSSVLETNEGTVSELNVSSHIFVSEAQSERSVPNVPSSSEELREDISLSDECQSSERTVPCIESSDQVKKIVIESAESTSDNSGSLENMTIREKSTYSPLRRRLVRPAPIDRRPDTTVSSTVDSQTNVHTVDRVIGDSLTKDVSSSSDAISSRLSSETKQNQENREVSICKAETSVSPSKRIKLVRHKNVPQLTPGDIKVKNVMESQVCQSTSSEVPSPSLIELVSGNPLVNSISIMESTSEDSRFDSHIDCSKAESAEWNVTESRNENADSKGNIPLLITNSESEDSKCENKNETCVPKELMQIDSNMPSSSKISQVQHQENSESFVKHSESEIVHEQSETKVPKLTIKLNNKPLEETKSLPKLTIKTLKPRIENEDIPKNSDDFIPNVTKINIKPIPRPSEKFNEVHRKSSSSDVSESESSENDDSASTSDQTSTSDHGTTDVVPKVTIKLGKPGTDTEGQFYTEKNVPKLTIIKHLNLDNQEDDSNSKIKLMVCQPEEIQSDKIPKLTIKPISRNLDSQPLSPKLTIKPIKPQERSNDLVENQQIPKLKITHELVSPICDLKENIHVPKITIKSVTKTEEIMSKLKKFNVKTDSSEHIPVVTKLNIKPIVKPIESSESTSDILEESEEKVPVVSKINIKPIVKPKDICKDIRLDCIAEEIPRVTKINIKPLKEPDSESLRSHENKEWHTQNEEKNIPVITKINIKPLVKPSAEESKEKDLCVTGNPVNESIPVVTKLTIKPLIKPNDIQDDTPSRAKTPDADTIPVVTKLNIKPILKPDEAPSSPKKEKMETKNVEIPVITKLNIKPIVKPDDHDSSLKQHRNRDEEAPIKNPPLVMKINIKAMSENSGVENIQTAEDVPKENNLDHSECNNIKDNELTLFNPADHLSKNEEVTTKMITDNKIEQVEEKSLNIHSQESTSNLNSDIKMNCNASELNQSLAYVSPNCELEIKDNLIVPEKDQKLIMQDTTTKPNSVDESFADNKDYCARSRKMLEITQQKNLCESKNDERTENRPISQEFKTEGKGLEVNTEIPPLERSETQIQITANFEIEKKNDPSEGPKIDQNFQLLKRLLERDKNRDDSLQNTSIENKISESVSTLDKLLASDSDKVCKMSFVDSMCDDNAVSEVIENTTMCSKAQDLRRDAKSEGDMKTSRLKFQESVIKDSNVPAANSDLKESRSVLSQALSKPALDLTKSKCRITQDKPLSPENISKPLEITTTEKMSLESSGQDSPRIILKINKTEQGASAKIITEDVKKADIITSTPKSDNTQIISEKPAQQRNTISTRKKKSNTELPNIIMGKRLRSSKVIQDADKPPVTKRNIGKKAAFDNNTTAAKESELSILETKRLRLGQLLSNKSLTITPISKKGTDITTTNRQIGASAKPTPGKNINHSVLNNENCSKNGNSKLHNILSNLHAKHDLQIVKYNEVNCNVNKNKPVMQEIDSTNTSTASSDVIEIVPVTNSHLQVQEMLISENSNSREFNEVSEEVSQDPLDIEPSKVSTDISSGSLITESSISITHPPMTPQPKKRGRPRKLPVSEGPKTVTLPVPALEERPQRSLRLSRGQPLPTALIKPRGRGRGRGVKRALTKSSETPPTPESLVEKANKFFVSEEKDVETSDLAMKLPRLTEALEKMPSVCSTPLSSRKDSIDAVLFSETPELKVMLESIPKIEDSLLKRPENESQNTTIPRGRGRGGRGRGSRGGRPLRTPRGRGRRGGGRGAMYMKETMGIYGRVCGPATTTIQLFEEETCMMDDNATPAKLELMDEDSQSSIKSSTNDSNKMKKSKFTDLFESNKVWTASDIKEYMWPPPNTPSANPQVMMIQEQVAMFLGVKSFRRSYPELKRRTIVGEERDYVLNKEIVTEAFCDLGVTAVDASEVLDIMLSDYPHKYEEYRSYQRRRQLSEPPPAPSEPAPTPPPEKPSEDKPDIKQDTKLPEIKSESIPERNKQSMQDLAAAAITAASEWNTRLNAMRRPACVDLQTMTVHKRRVSGPPPLPPRVQPPAGFYPHALLPGQYQHWFRVYTPEQLSYFPLNTVMEAPPPPAEVKPSETSSESEGEWGSSSSSDESDTEQTSSSKRKKPAKPRSEAGSESRDGEDKCNKCGLREEATRKYSHERFLACANCSAKVHPSCLELGPDTVRKCRAYAWQCAECKSCGSCARPADDDKMLFCDLCDRGFHIYCVGLSAVPSGRWHCVECSVCKSCGARTPAGLSGAATTADIAEPQWHHQSKRGPGGIKIYSHSLCAPCARAYRIGRYCPICDRSFIGPKGTMQLVICKLCDRQLHQDCVRQTVTRLDVMDYTCGGCRRSGITSRAAAARVAPRTIATLFMAKRRFNKYAHRQYMESRMRSKTTPPEEDDND